MCGDTKILSIRGGGSEREKGKILFSKGLVWEENELLSLIAHSLELSYTATLSEDFGKCNA
jgi:hypothetical protein